MKIIEREQLYQELSKLLEAGFAVNKALEVLLEQNLSATSRAVLERVEQGLENGLNVADAFASQPEISEMESVILEAGEQGGLLERSMDHLGHYFEMLRHSRRTIRNAMIYPVILLHLAVFLPVLPAYFTKGSFSAAITPALIALVVVYGIAALIWFFCRLFLKPAETDAKLDRLFMAIPFIGNARKALAMSRFAQVFHIFLTSGLMPSVGISQAGAASQSGQIHAASQRTAQAVAAGNRVGPEISKEAIFSPAFTRSVDTAEQSGTLDEDLARWNVHFREEAHSAMEAVSRWAPKVFYSLVALYVAFQIVVMAKNYIGLLNSLLEM